MPNYNQAHAFYAGADLHARSLFVHVLDARGKTVYERDLPAEPAPDGRRSRFLRRGPRRAVTLRGSRLWF